MRKSRHYGNTHHAIVTRNFRTIELTISEILQPKMKTLWSNFVQCWYAVEKQQQQAESGYSGSDTMSHKRR